MIKQLEIKVSLSLLPKQLNKLDLVIYSTLELKHSDCHLDTWSVYCFYIKYWENVW